MSRKAFQYAFHGVLLPVPSTCYIHERNAQPAYNYHMPVNVRKLNVRAIISVKGMRSFVPYRLEMRFLLFIVVYMAHSP